MNAARPPRCRIASYYPHSTPRAQDGPPRDPPARIRLGPADVADLMGCMTLFPPDKLKALYGAPERYDRRLDTALQRLVNARWISETDAERARQRDVERF